jgi:hypothetical protein
MVRKHFVLPKELADRFEQLVGPRRQSEEIAAMIARRLLSEERAEFFRENAGFGTAESNPEWATDKDIVEWVRKLRREGWERPETRQWQEEQQRADDPR